MSDWRDEWPKGPLDLSNTAEALERLDSMMPKIQAKWDAAGEAGMDTDEAVAEAQRFEKCWEDEVRRAFYEDSKDRNCLDNCMLVGIESDRLVR